MLQIMEGHYAINVALPVKTQTGISFRHYFVIVYKGYNTDIVQQIMDEQRRTYPDAKVTVTRWTGSGQPLDM